MTRRAWTVSMTPEVLSDLERALREMASELDECSPEECVHPEQLVTPLEFFQWVEREVMLARRRPVRFEPGHRPRRRRLTLAG